MGAVASGDVVVEGLVEPGSLLWHGDALWLADRSDRRVVRVDPELGELVTVTWLVGDQPGGLTWFDDRLFVTARASRLLLTWAEGEGLRRAGDLSPVAAGEIGAVVSDQAGGLFVADEGAAVHGSALSRDAGRILRMDPDGTVSIVADELESPSGLALSGDGGVLYVSERSAGRITSFTVGRDGALADRRTFSALAAAESASGSAPTGLCFDAGDLWCVDSLGGRVVRIGTDGLVSRELAVDGAPTSCWAVGPTGAVLVATAPIGPLPTGRRDGRVIAFSLEPAA